EDGIRDRTVTGVQTCALPIFPLPKLGRRISGANPAGMLVDQLPPPSPAGMATYCLPLARYVMGNPCAEVGSRVCHRIFPPVASRSEERRVGKGCGSRVWQQRA